MAVLHSMTAREEWYPAEMLSYYNTCDSKIKEALIEYSERYGGGILDNVSLSIETKSFGLTCTPHYLMSPESQEMERHLEYATYGHLSALNEFRRQKVDYECKIELVYEVELTYKNRDVSNTCWYFDRLKDILTEKGITEAVVDYTDPIIWLSDEYYGQRLRKFITIDFSKEVPYEKAMVWMEEYGKTSGKNK